MARSNHERSKFLEALKEHPLISVAAKRVGIARSTIHRWLKSNPEFKALVDEAMSEGRSHWVDIAESALMKRINAGDINAIKFLLAHNSPRYRPLRSIIVEPLSASERRELERYRRMNKPIPNDTLESILRAFKNYGLIKKNPPSEPRNNHPE
jgi:hypothetical protein